MEIILVSCTQVGSECRNWTLRNFLPVSSSRLPCESAGTNLHEAGARPRNWRAAPATRGQRAIPCAPLAGET